MPNGGATFFQIVGTKKDSQAAQLEKDAGVHFADWLLSSVGRDLIHVDSNDVVPAAPGDAGSLGGLRRSARRRTQADCSTPPSAASASSLRPWPWLCGLA